MLLQIKPQICNVVCTADLKQRINIASLANIQYGLYDKSVYRGNCAYIKMPKMKGRVTIFSTGKMISVGEKSIKKSIKQLNNAKKYLVHEKIINNIQLIPETRNIVALIDMKQPLPIHRMVPLIHGAIYEPETFPGMILKRTKSSFLIFASGKIVSTGTKSMEDLRVTSFEITNKLMIMLE